MGKHSIGRRDRGGSYQELCNMMLQRLGGLDPNDDGVAVAPPADEWVSPDEWCQQHSSGKAVQR